MKIKKAMLTVGMVFAIISMIGNYLFFTSKQLNQPIMLKHYYDTQVSVDSMLQFQYLTNRNDETKIAWFTLPDLDITLPVFEDQIYNTFRHHQIKILHVNVPEELEEIMNNGEIHLTEVEAHFSNGDIQLMDIGDVILRKYKENKTPFEFSASGSSSDDTGFAVAVAKKDVNITDLEIPFADKFEKAIKLYVGENQRTPENHSDIVPKGELLTKDSFPILKKKGDYLSMEYEIKFDKDDKNKLHLYTFEIKMIGKDEDGKTFSFPDTIYYQPELTEKDIAAIIQGDQ
ncbi:hypothetical protein ACFFF5_18175 [Lederbergia wuyishanensis]|uniref:Uncharacterized protein n=1 Tax=Lederbergia wuyishanensis TaxID=1347903 RepID=A0ABU0D4P6_9BACI|nr:hypothetical protein [Lederbergia wuyishanensis]MCJ8008045.1 hypothetical protein [Lederbergia wuyishanensis]MDQ0343370.1 hypothetical protein [Lederbergia wuyishanensis]